MSTKKITVNPDLFNTGGSTRKNRGEKKAKPVIPIQINENSLKKKFLNRIKEHKNKEKIESGLKSGGGTQNEIKVKEQIANQTNDGDEFRDSLQYLSLLSKKKKEEGLKKRNMATIQNKTVKNPYSTPMSNMPPHVELELPEELKEPIRVTPETPVMNLNYDDNYKNYFNHNNQFQQRQPQTPAQTPPPRSQYVSTTPNLIQNQSQPQLNSLPAVIDPPYGCLKNANKPTYRNWVRTKRNTGESDEIIPQSTTYSSNIHFSPDPQNERQKRLEQLRKKMKEDEIQKLNSYNNATTMPEKESPILINDTQPVSQTTNTKEEPDKRYIKRTIKKKYTLGKSNVYRKVGILIKNNATRKKIINAQKELKKKSIHDIKKYLVEHGLLKVGSNAPNNVLRKTYESSMLTGEVVNQNKDVLIHNLMNDTGDHV